MSTEQLVSSPLGDATKQDDVVDDGEVLEIDVIDDVPEEDRNRVPPGGEHDQELSDVSQSVQKRIKKLKYEYHQERRGKDSANRMKNEAVNYAQKVAEENRQLRELLNRGEQVLIDEVKSRTEKDVASAKQQLKRAHEVGDSDALVEAEEFLAKAAYEAQKASEYSPVSSGVEPIQEQQPEPQQNARTQPDSRATQWAQENTWFQNDREMTAVALAAHADLIASGVNPQSDEYYNSIDQRVRNRFPEKFGGDEAETDVSVNEKSPRPSGTPRRPSTVVAPAKRNTGSKSRKVRMTQTQKALAKRLGITPEQYAKQVLVLEKQNG